MTSNAEKSPPDEDMIKVQKIKEDVEAARLFHENTFVQATDNGPHATPERAAEIAGMDKFGLLEFWELTGIGGGPYGIYEIREEGIVLRLADVQSNLTEQSRVSIRNFVERSSLSFPCFSADFLIWYEGTRAKNGVSDFPLANGFLKALDKEFRVESINEVDPVPSQKIIEAFPVETDFLENKRWWGERMRSAVKYAGLLDARASKGKGGSGNPSYWHPMVVAAWLIDKDHLAKNTVIHAVQTHFPECNVDLL